MSTEPHLWEVDHPYYATEGNYYAKPGERHEEYSSWRSFTGSGFHAGDRDLNLLYRWDWFSPTRHPDLSMRGTGVDYLALYFILQRKAIACSVNVRINDEDEPDVREWLAKCAAKVAAIWDPINLAATGESH
jgi:hypothetical protein